jgi:hypothetical protein
MKNSFLLSRISYRTVNTFHLVYKNQPVDAVSGTSRFITSDKYNTQIQCGQRGQLLDFKRIGASRDR